MLRFVEPDLRRIEETGASLVVCACFEDERPMQGLAGLLDWRLAGSLSARLREEFMRGESGDALLVPSRPRFACDRLVAVGLGSKAAFDDAAFRRAILHVARIVSGLQSRRTAIELPGRGGNVITPERAAELALDTAADLLHAEGVWLVESSQDQHAFEQRAKDDARRVRHFGRTAVT